MRNPIENLGDYNRMRIDLQEKDGDLGALYKDIGDTAVDKETPRLMLKGGVIGSAITVLIIKGFKFMKKRKQRVKKEPDLKEKFAKAVKTESSKPDTEEPIQDMQI